MQGLTLTDLKNLIRSIFPDLEENRHLAFLVDFPKDGAEDHSEWATRREMAWNWFKSLKQAHDEGDDLNLDSVALIGYASVGNNNADLPSQVFKLADSLPTFSNQLSKAGEEKRLEEIFSTYQLLMAPTEHSTTAPLKNAAKKFGFRGATMPGFSSKMIPALRIDYQEVSRRVGIIKEKVDPAEFANVRFRVEGHEDCNITFDLRFRKGHLSAGQLPEIGTAGNAPSGETYIVPYEGERPDTPSETNGCLPIQEGEDLVFFDIVKNKAVRVHAEPSKPESLLFKKEQEHLKREPAYGNMAELGFGVLGDFGLKPIGEILLDEKLGFHVAFGRSDHFGGMVGPQHFSGPSEVIHLDRIYIPGCQPRIRVAQLSLVYPDQTREDIIVDGNYVVF